MAIYRRGTAGLAANGVVTGVDTKWQDKLSLIRVGATMVFLTQPLTLVTISAIVSDTEMRAIQTDDAVVPDGTNYVILLHDSITVDGLAQDVAETLRYYQSKETVIEEAMDFFKNFNLQELKDLQSAVRVDADRTEVNANEAEASKNAAAGSAQSAQQDKNAAAASASSSAADAATATSAKNAAADSAFNAKTSETNAGNSASSAAQSNGEAAAHRQAAEVAATQAGASKDAARVSETNAANSETSAGQSAAAARDDAARAKAEADRAATANPDEQLKKANNLSDLTDVQAARTNLDLDWLRHIGTRNYISTPDRTKRLTIGDDGIFQWQDSNGNVIPIPIGSGGTGSTTADGARNNLGIGSGQAVRFGGVEATTLGSATSGGLIESKRLSADGATLQSNSRFYNELQGGVVKTTIHTANTAGGKGNYYQFDEAGNITGVASLTAVGTISGGALVATNGNVEAKQGKSIVVSTQSGGNKNILIQNAAGDGSVNSWVNLVQGNWYSGYWQIGGVRGSGTDIDHFKIGVNNQGSDWKEFKFINSYGGHISSPRGFLGKLTQGGWAQPNDYMGSTFFAGDVTGNDAGYASLISGATTSTGGYRMNTSLGMISSGNNGWPRAVIKMLGDGAYHRGFEFHAPSSDIISWGQGGGWDGGYTFQKAPTSDRDLKWDIKYTEGKESYDRVMQWLPTMFKYKGSDTQRFGLIAQDLNKVDSQYVKVVPGAPIFEDVIGVNENGEEYVARQIETGFKDDTLALDSNVMLTDMACAMVYMGNRMEEMEERLAKLESLLLK